MLLTAIAISLLVAWLQAAPGIVYKKTSSYTPVHVTEDHIVLKNVEYDSVWPDSDVTKGFCSLGDIIIKNVFYGNNTKSWTDPNTEDFQELIQTHVSGLVFKAIDADALVPAIPSDNHADLDWECSVGANDTDFWHCYYMHLWLKEENPVRNAPIPIPMSKRYAPMVELIPLADEPEKYACIGMAARAKFGNGSNYCCINKEYVTEGEAQSGKSGIVTAYQPMKGGRYNALKLNPDVMDEVYFTPDFVRAQFAGYGNRRLCKHDFAYETDTRTSALCFEPPVGPKLCEAATEFFVVKSLSKSNGTGMCNLAVTKSYREYNNPANDYNDYNDYTDYNDYNDYNDYIKYEDPTPEQAFARNGKLWINVDSNSVITIPPLVPVLTNMVREAPTLDKYLNTSLVEVSTLQMTYHQARKADFQTDNKHQAFPNDKLRRDVFIYSLPVNAMIAPGLSPVASHVNFGFDAGVMVDKRDNFIKTTKYSRIGRPVVVVRQKVNYTTPPLNINLLSNPGPYQNIIDFYEVECPSGYSAIGHVAIDHGDLIVYNDLSQYATCFRDDILEFAPCWKEKVKSVFTNKNDENDKVLFSMVPPWKRGLDTFFIGDVPKCLRLKRDSIVFVPSRQIKKIVVKSYTIEPAQTYAPTGNTATSSVAVASLIIVNNSSLEQSSKVGIDYTRTNSHVATDSDSSSFSSTESNTEGHESSQDNTESVAQSLTFQAGFFGIESFETSTEIATEFSHGTSSNVEQTYEASSTQIEEQTVSFEESTTTSHHFEMPVKAAPFSMMKGSIVVQQQITDAPFKMVMDIYFRDSGKVTDYVKYGKMRNIAQGTGNVKYQELGPIVWNSTYINNDTVYL